VVGVFGFSIALPAKIFYVFAPARRHLRRPDTKPSSVTAHGTPCSVATEYVFLKSSRH
jgi:hypothetical protein